VHAATRGAELVYHQGALPSVPRSIQDPLTTSAVNVEGTLNVLLAARDEGIRRVVFSSSTSGYGATRELPTTEATPPDPLSPYGVA
jgi:UDP-glucose 4-epimerase